ncbi:hypothetical protein [Aquipuribacter sp. SD81]|uniref:hypothetical protein n=1 Tax=Aquipuribacter sp. SD81 TaxID=3127703 RepID=UPI0030172756
MSDQPEEPYAGQDLADPDAPLATSGASAPHGGGQAHGARDAPHPHGPEHADPVLDEVEAHADPAVVALVHEVRDRFGARGLRDAITLAGYELDIAERAAAELAALGDDSEPATGPA